MKGVFIPGLSMEKHELPEVPGFLRLQNPEVGDGPAFPEKYEVTDLALFHLKKITELAPKTGPFHIVGMSLGGMITSVLASELRSKLPSQCHFHFFVTSASTPQHPAATRELLESWRQVQPGDREGLKRILSPFFSPTYLESSAAEFERYLSYRLSGGNKQSPKSFMKQVAAVFRFNGSSFYSKVDPQECSFLHGESDRVFDQRHHQDLKTLVPEAKHQVIAQLGHMVNLEQPQYFSL